MPKQAVNGNFELGFTAPSWLMPTEHGGGFDRLSALSQAGFMKARFRGNFSSYKRPAVINIVAAFEHSHNKTFKFVTPAMLAPPDAHCVSAV